MGDFPAFWVSRYVLELVADIGVVRRSGGRRHLNGEILGSMVDLGKPFHESR
jgi:hypothetical protein